MMDYFASVNDLLINTYSLIQSAKTEQGIGVY